MAIFNNSKLYSTHNPMLIKMVQATRGGVIECGAGVFSTPLLHWLLIGTRRMLITYETHPEFFQFAKRFQSKYHRIRLVDNWLDLKPDRHWSVVFIDQDKNRAETAMNFKDYADYIILHDSNAARKLGYDKIYPHFKYQYEYTGCRPYTIVLSNFRDI